MSSLKLVLGVLLCAATVLAQEPITRQINLAEMTDSAGTIVRARILDLRFEAHPDYPNIKTLRITAEVLESVRGAGGRRITFREYAAHGQSRMKQVQNQQHNYRVGEEVVLFLYPPSKAGFSSPVGGSQGKFEVIRRGGQGLVSNGVRNMGLFRGVEEAAAAKGIVFSAGQRKVMKQTPAELKVDDLLGIVRQLAKGRAR